jgi:hypothetical protein
MTLRLVRAFFQVSGFRFQLSVFYFLFIRVIRVIRG